MVRRALRIREQGKANIYPRQFLSQIIPLQAQDTRCFQNTGCLATEERLEVAAGLSGKHVPVTSFQLHQLIMLPLFDDPALF